MLKSLLFSSLLVQIAWTQSPGAPKKPSNAPPPPIEKADSKIPVAPITSFGTVIVDPIPGASAPKLVCKAIPGDKEWPADEVWTKGIPGVEKSEAQVDNITRPDWVLNAKGAEDVAAAVKFAAKHQIRVSIINSGHDFVGRNDAPNGLWIHVGNIRGVRVEQNYEATEKGTDGVKWESGTF
jgi:hypothetical protein